MVVSSIDSCAFEADGSGAISPRGQTNANGPDARPQQEGAENPSRDAASGSDAEQESIASIAAANHDLPIEGIHYLQRRHLIRQHVRGRDAFAAHCKNMEVLRFAQRQRRRIALLTYAYGTADPRRWHGPNKLTALVELESFVRQVERETNAEIEEYRGELQRLGYSPAEIRELVRRVRCCEPIEHVQTADNDLVSGGTISGPPPSAGLELSTEEHTVNNGSASDSTVSSSPPSRRLEASSTDDDCCPRQNELRLPIKAEARSSSSGRANATGPSPRRPIRTPSLATIGFIPRGWSVVRVPTKHDEGYSLGAVASPSRRTRGSGRPNVGRTAEVTPGMRVKAEPKERNLRRASGTVGSERDGDDKMRGTCDREDTAPHAPGGSGENEASTTNSGRGSHLCGMSGAARGEPHAGGTGAPAAVGPPGVEDKSPSTLLRRNGHVGAGNDITNETGGESTTSRPSSEAVLTARVDKHERLIMKIHKTMKSIDSLLQGVQREHSAAAVGRDKGVQPAKIDTGTQTFTGEDPFARVVSAERQMVEELPRHRHNGLISILEKRLKREKADALALRREILKNEFEADLRAKRAEVGKADLQAELLSLRQRISEQSRARPEKAGDCVARTAEKTGKMPTEAQTPGIALEEHPRSASVEKSSIEERMSKVFGMVNSAFCSAMRFMQTADWEGIDDDTLMVQALSLAIGPGYFVQRNVPVGSAHEGCSQGHDATSSNPSEGLGQRSDGGEGIESNRVQPTSRSSPTMAPSTH